MVIAVIGAGGKSGRMFVDAALHAGHTVRAGIHGDEVFSPHERLRVLRCDATKHKQVSRLLEGSDAVVSLMGHIKGSPPFVQTEAITVILNEMNSHDINRIISLTGTGVRATEDTPSFIDRVLNTAVKLVDPERIHDGIAHAVVLQESSVDWTVLRVLKLGNGGVQEFQLTDGDASKLVTNRSTVAQAVLVVLDAPEYYKKMLVIS